MDDAEKLKESMEARAPQQELFEKKVFMIGELHTRRALLANRVGRLKSESMMDENCEDDIARNEALDLEKEMSGISKSITDFRPENLDELKDFHQTTSKSMDTVEEKIIEAESKLKED